MLLLSPALNMAQPASPFTVQPAWWRYASETKVCRADVRVKPGTPRVRSLNNLPFVLSAVAGHHLQERP